MCGQLPLVLPHMTVGVALSATGSDNQIDATVRLAREAAAAGLRSAWFGQTFGADSPQLAAIVGREVPDLQVGTSAIPVFGRHPLLVASTRPRPHRPPRTAATTSGSHSVRNR